MKRTQLSQLQLPLHPTLLFCVLLVVLSACASGNSQTQAKQLPVQFYDVHKKLICQLQGQDTQLDCLKQTTPYTAFFIKHMLDELSSDLHVQIGQLPTTGLTVVTTLDLDLAQQTWQKTHQTVKVMHDEHNLLNAAVVIIDPASGGIRSLLGNIDDTYTKDTPNNAMRLRANGATLKPFIYATAFEQGISPGEVVYDGPVTVGSNPPYTPFNASMAYYGYMSYRTSLKTELNIPSVKLIAKVGPETVGKKIQMMVPNYQGKPSLTLPIDGLSMTLLDETSAYATFANGGTYIAPHTILSVTSADGHSVYQTTLQKKRVWSPEATFMLTDVLSDRQLHEQEFGPCNLLEISTATPEQCKAGKHGSVQPAAAMVGMSAFYTDTFTFGYTPDFAVGVWAGNNDGSPMFDVYGTEGAGQIWHDTLLLARGKAPIQSFPGPPANVVKKTVNYPHLTTTDWYIS